MCASREGMRKEVYIVLACEQLKQSAFETGDVFTVVITGDLNEEIISSNSGKAGSSFGACSETSVLTPSV